MQNKIIGKVAPLFVGDFDNERVYARLDVVFYDGESWLCLFDGTQGKIPGVGDSWQIVSPRGLQGTQGTQGVQGTLGYQGRQGEVGSKGKRGPQGTQGRKGIQGSQGYQGDQGDEGLQGYQGNQGNQGRQGILGYQGTQGSLGNQGYQGNQGEKGYQGNKGNQGIQGNRGFQGYQGYQGYQGAQGNRGYEGNQGNKGLQGYQGNQGYVGAQGTIGEKGYQGFLGSQGSLGNQGSQGYQGTQGNKGYQGSLGDVYLPEVDDDFMLTYIRTRIEDITLDEVGPFDIMPEIVSYGYTKLAKPEITKEFENNIDGYKSLTPKPQPEGTPVSLGSSSSATNEMPYIWRKTNKKKDKDGNDLWELWDAKYVPLEEIIGKGIAEPIINVSLSYGSVVVDTDLSWSIFREDMGGENWTPSDGALIFKPAVIVNPLEIVTATTGLGVVNSETGANGHQNYFNESINTNRYNPKNELNCLSLGNVDSNFVLTLERWDRNDTESGPKLTTTSALEIIFDAIKQSNPETGFKWSRFKEYYNDKFPYAPIVIKFTNGVFTIQDIHDLTVTNDELTSITLYGSLSVFNSMNSFVQGSHGNMNKYALDTGMKISLSKICSATIGSSTYNVSFVFMRLLPYAS